MEVINSPANKSCDEEGTVSIEIDSSSLSIASTTELAADFLEVKPQVLRAMVCKNGTSTDCCIMKGNSVCDDTDTSAEESLVPSAKALCVALQTSSIPFIEAEGSLLSETARKCYVGFTDSRINIDQVSDRGDSDSQTVTPELICSSCASDLDDRKAVSKSNISVAKTEILDKEESAQTHQCTLVKVIKQETVNENTLMRYTDEGNKGETSGNFNDFRVTLSKSDKSCFVTSAKEIDSGVREESGVSVATRNIVKIFHESSKIDHCSSRGVSRCSKSAGLLVDVGDVVTVNDSRLAKQNNGNKLKEQQNQLQSEKEKNEHSSEGLDFGESENFFDEQFQKKDESKTLLKKVKESLDRSGGEVTERDVSSLFINETVLSKLDERYGVPCTTKKEVKNEVKVKNECTENAENENPVNTTTQLQNVRLTCDVDVETGSTRAFVKRSSVTNGRSSAMEMTTKIGPVSKFELNNTDPVEDGNCENTRAVDHLQGSKHAAITEKAVTELSNFAQADDSLADKETSFFNSQETSQGEGEGCQVSESCKKVETYSSSCGTVGTNQTSKVNFPSDSTSSFIELQIDSSSFSLIVTKKDSPFCPKEKTKATSMGLDVSTRERCIKGHVNKRTSDGISEDVDINQHLTEHGVASTERVPVIGTSNYDTLSGIGKRSDVRCISLEVSSVSGEDLKGSKISLRENQAVSRDPPCLILDLNSDKLLDKCEDEVRRSGQIFTRNREENKCQLIVSNEFGKCGEIQKFSPPVHGKLEEMPAKPQIKTSQTGHIQAQFNEAEVTHDFSALNWSDQPDSGESLLLDTITSCDVEYLTEKGNGENIDSEIVASNSTSEDFTMKSGDRDTPPKNGAGAELTCNNLKKTGEEKTKYETGAPLTYIIDESRPRVDDEKEEGEISSDDDDTSRTEKPAEKEREEGELSSSDSDIETSDEQQTGVSLFRGKLPGNKNVLSSKEKRLCPTRQYSSSGLRKKFPNERDRIPENSRCVKNASLSSFRNTDLRTELSEVGNSRLSLKSRSSGISDRRDNRLGETRPVERRMKGNGTAKKCSAKGENERGPRQETVVRDTAKGGNKMNIKNSTLNDASLKRRETRQQGNKTFHEGKPERNQGKDESKDNCLKPENKVNRKSGEIKVKKTNPISSRQRTKDSFNNSRLDHEEVMDKSTDLCATEDKKNTRNSRSLQGHERNVKGKQSKIKLEPSVTKTTRSAKGEEKKAANDLHTVSRAKANASSRVTKETITPNPLAKATLRDNYKTNKNPAQSSIMGSQQPYSEKATMEKEATVLTNHRTGDNKNDEVRNNVSSQGEVQSKAGKRFKANDKAKPMASNVAVKRGFNDKGNPTRAKNTIKISPRVTPREAFKKLLSRVTSKAKVQPQHGNKDRIGNPRKRTTDTTGVREAKRLRLEDRNDFSKLTNDSSTTEISKPSTKRGHYKSNRENQPPSCQLNVSENLIIAAGGEELKSADEHTCLDNSMKTANALGRTLSKTLVIGRNKRLVFKHRHVNQLFVRGDNVVMVAYAK